MKAQAIVDRILIGTVATYCGIALGFTLSAEARIRARKANTPEPPPCLSSTVPEELVYRRTFPQIPEPPTDPEPPLIVHPLP